MKFRIRHKGFLVVAIPCAIQVCIIATLAYILAATQDEHARAERRRGLALDAARMVLSNCHASVFIIKSTTMDRLPLDRFSQIYYRVEKLVARFEKSTALVQNQALKEVGENCVRIERGTLKLYRDFRDITTTGVNFSNLDQARKLRRELWTGVDASFDAIAGLLDFLEQRQHEGEKSLRQLKQLELIVLATGIGINIIAALLLVRFFNTDVLGRVAAIRKNIKAMEAGQTAYLPVSGTDEIAELDSSFRQMSEEINRVRENEKALFDNTADIICILDAQSRIASINPAVKRILGFSPEELDGRQFRSILPSIELARFNKALLVSKMDHGIPVMFESVINNQHEEQKDLLWSIVWSVEQSQWFCIVRDISNDKQIEKRKREFLALIVNDLQKPLHQIADQLDAVMQEKHQSEKLEKRLGAAVRTMNRLKSLVDNLTKLDVLDNQMETPAPVVQRYAVLSVVSDAVREIEDLASARKIEIVVEGESSTWMVDRNQIVRVLVNLLSNAIKFSPDGDKILVHVKKVNETIFVDIEDHGRGIPEDQIGKLFRPFRQVEIDDGTRGRGSGLGLLTCKKIIEAHDGNIGVNSTEGRGSKFWFSIPVTSRTLIDELSDNRFKQELEAQQGETTEGANAERTDFTPGMSLTRKAWMLVFVPVVFELFFVAFMMFQLSHERVSIEQESLKRRVASSSIVMNLDIFRLGASLERLITDPGRAQQCVEAIDRAEHGIATFKHAVAKGKSLSLPVSSVEYPLKDLIQAIRNARQLLLEKTVTGSEIRDISGLISSGADEMSTQVEELLDRYEAGTKSFKTNRRNFGLSIFLLAGLTVSSVVAWMMATMFSRDLSKRLSDLAANCQRFASNQPLTPTRTVGDEISELDASFRKTANRILELREKENAFLKNSQSLICSLNQDAVFQSINPIAEQILNCPPEQIISRTLMDFVSPEQTDSVTTAFNSARQSETPCLFQCHITTAARDLLWSVSWSQRFSNFFAIAHDITKQIELERLKREYTAIISHDLRTPLTTILGTSILINTEAFGAVSEKTRDGMNSVKDESERIIELINDLLDLEKLAAGEMRLRYESVDLKDIVESAQELLRNACKKASDCSISIECGEHEMLADKERLAFSLAALLSEIASTGAEQISIRVDRRDQFVSLKITSPVNENSMVFENRFANPMNPDLPSAFGSRLRLPLALATLRAHQATVQIDFQGDEFVVELQLPLAPAMG